MKKTILIMVLLGGLITLNACSHVKACCAGDKTTESHVCSKCGGTSCAKSCEAGK